MTLPKCYSLDMRSYIQIVIIKFPFHICRVHPWRSCFPYPRRHNHNLRGLLNETRCRNIYIVTFICKWPVCGVLKSKFADFLSTSKYSFTVIYRNKILQEILHTINKKHVWSITFLWYNAIVYHITSGYYCPLVNPTGNFKYG